VAVTVAATAIPAVDRNTGDDAVTPLTVTDGNVGPAAKIGNAINTINNPMYLFIGAILFLNDDSPSWVFRLYGLEQLQKSGRFLVYLLW
jgi:hypothetical protein